MIPGNDQNTSSTYQGTAGSKLKGESYLTFYGSWRHLKSFSGGFFGVNLFTSRCSKILHEKFGIELNSNYIKNHQTMSAFSGDSHDMDSPGSVSYFK